MTGLPGSHGDTGERRRTSDAPVLITDLLDSSRATAEELSRCLLKEHAPPVLDAEDIEDGLGELANVVGGNVKAVLPGPSVLGLPEVGSAPAAGSDACRVDLLWRGQSLTISVQGSAGALLDQ